MASVSFHNPTSSYTLMDGTIGLGIGSTVYQNNGTNGNNGIHVRNGTFKMTGGQIIDVTPTDYFGFSFNNSAVFDRRDRRRRRCRQRVGCHGQPQRRQHQCARRHPRRYCQSFERISQYQWPDHHRDGRRHLDRLPTHHGWCQCCRRNEHERTARWRSIRRISSRSREGFRSAIAARAF